MTWLNVGCGTHIAPKPWLNLDHHRGDGVEPDILTTPDDPFPFPIHDVERVLLSHVLEHIELERLPWFFSELRRISNPGTEILIIGPDVYRTLERWRQGSESTALMHSVMEHADYPGTTDWPAATHHWTCHEQRLLDILKFERFQATPLNRPPDTWPSWNWAEWQCCISARLEIV